MTETTQSKTLVVVCKNKPLAGAVRGLVAAADMSHSLYLPREADTPMIIFGSVNGAFACRGNHPWHSNEIVLDAGRDLGLVAAEIMVWTKANNKITVGSWDCTLARDGSISVGCMWFDKKAADQLVADVRAWHASPEKKDTPTKYLEGTQRYSYYILATDKRVWFGNSERALVEYILKVADWRDSIMSAANKPRDNSSEAALLEADKRNRAIWPDAQSVFPPPPPPPPPPATVDVVKGVDPVTGATQGQEPVPGLLTEPA